MAWREEYSVTHDFEINYEIASLWDDEGDNIFEDAETSPFLTLRNLWRFFQLGY